MTLSRLKVFGGLFLAAILSLPAWAASKTAQPGTLNYVEGEVSIGDQPVDAQSVGNVTLQNGQILSTGNGRAEILLTPGVFLRVDNNSSVAMDSLSLINTEVMVNQGRAMVEADQVHSQNDLRVIEGNMPTQITKDGLYEFDADQGKVLVYKGEARYLEGDDGAHVTIDGGHMIDFNEQGKLKSHEFNKDEYEQSNLYRWSSLRSDYLAEANVDAARTYVVNGYYGPGWVGPGWYWSPWYSAYTWIPGDGFFYSPFGFGFYSPIVVVRSPFFFGGPHFVHTFNPGFRGPVIVGHPGFVGRPGFVGHPGVGNFRPGVSRGVVARGPVMHGGSSGGFHGGGGGFHGGGGGIRR